MKWGELNKDLCLLLENINVLNKCGVNIVPWSPLIWGYMEGGNVWGGWRALWIFDLSYSAGRCFSWGSRWQWGSCGKSHQGSQCSTLTHGQILRKIHRSKEIPRACSHFTLRWPSSESIGRVCLVYTSKKEKSKYFCGFCMPVAGKVLTGLAENAESASSPSVLG